AGIGSVSVTPVAGAVPVFWMVMLYLRGAPATTVAGVVFLLASIRAMPVVTVLVVKLPFCVGSPAEVTEWYVNLAVAWCLAGAGLAGIEVTRTWNVTVLVAPAATVPMLMPAAGLAPGCTTPFTVNVPGTNVVPGGGGSVNTTLVAATTPRLVTTVV